MNILLLLFVAAVARAQLGANDCFGEGSFSSNIDKNGVIRGGERFGVNVFRNIALNFSSTSFVLSPYSIFGVMKLSYYGSAGKTEQELQTALGMPSKRDAFWASSSIDRQRQSSNEVTIQEMSKAYFANDMVLKECAFGKVVGIEKVNFKNAPAAAAQINADVEKATGGEIKNFLNAALVQNARYVLINAVYFNGKWVNQFDKSRTRDAKFFNEQGTVVAKPARMMEAKAKFGYAQYDSLRAEVLEMPYENSSISMMVILPNVGTTVNDVLVALDENHIQRMQDSLRTNSIVTVNMPAFNFTTKLNNLLKKSLIQAGIVSLFSPSDADLTNFVPNEKVYVDSTLHQATIRVDEEGTVAAAVTGLVITRTGIEKNINFTANRPFLFLLRDKKLNISYFIGLYRDPAHSRA